MESLHREQGDTTRLVPLDLQKSESYTGRHDHHFHVTGTNTPWRWRAGSRKRPAGSGRKQAGSGRRERRERWVLSKTPQPSGIHIPPVEIPSTPERDPSYKWRSLRLCVCSWVVLKILGALLCQEFSRCKTHLSLRALSILALPQQGRDLSGSRCPSFQHTWFLETARFSIFFGDRSQSELGRMAIFFFQAYFWAHRFVLSQERTLIGGLTVRLLCHSCKLLHEVLSSENIPRWLT